MEEGRIAIVTTRAGRRWTRVTSARRVLQGGQPWAKASRIRPVRLRTAKSCGPGARCLCAKARG